MRPYDDDLTVMRSFRLTADENDALAKAGLSVSEICRRAVKMALKGARRPQETRKGQRAPRSNCFLGSNGKRGGQRS